MNGRKTRPYDSIYNSSSSVLFTPLINQNESIFLHRKMSEGDAWVYIWYSSKNGGEGFGHMAFEFCHDSEEYYVSYWPKRTRLKNTGLLPTEGCWVKSRHDDYYNEEKRIPEYIRKLTNLNTEKMAEKLNELKEAISRWYLLGNIIEKEDSLNCVGVVVEMLKAGGIEELIGEEIIKSKRDEQDKGILPYKRSEKDEEIKKILKCLSANKCIKLALFCMYCLGSSTLGLALLLYCASDPEDYQRCNGLSDEARYSLGTIVVLVGLLSLCAAICAKKSTWSYEAAADQTITIAKNVFEIPYDSIRGLMEHSLVPDGRIKEIIDKAIAKTENQHTSILKEPEQNNYLPSVENDEENDSDIAHNNDVEAQTMRLGGNSY